MLDGTGSNQYNLESVESLLITSEKVRFVDWVNLATNPTPECLLSP